MAKSGGVVEPFPRRAMSAVHTARLAPYSGAGETNILSKEAAERLVILLRARPRLARVPDHDDPVARLERLDLLEKIFFDPPRALTSAPHVFDSFLSVQNTFSTSSI